MEKLWLELNIGLGQDRYGAKGMAQSMLGRKEEASLARMKRLGGGVMCDGRHGRIGRIKPWLKLEALSYG